MVSPLLVTSERMVGAAPATRTFRGQRSIWLLTVDAQPRGPFDGVWRGDQGIWREGELRRSLAQLDWEVLLVVVERDLVPHLARDRMPVGVAPRLLDDVLADAGDPGPDGAAGVVERTADLVVHDDGSARSSLGRLRRDRQRRTAAPKSIKQAHGRDSMVPGFGRVRPRQGPIDDPGLKDRCAGRSPAMRPARGQADGIGPPRRRGDLIAHPVPSPEDRHRGARARAR